MRQLRTHMKRVQGRIESSDDELITSIAYLSAALVTVIVWILAFLTVTAIVFWLAILADALS